MKNIQWTRRRLAGVAVAVTGVAVAGILAIGSAVANSGAAPSALGANFGFMQDHMNGRGGPGMRGGMHGGEHMTIVAKALGIDEAALRTELQGGKTIAALAQEKGVEKAAIVTALLEPRKADLAQRVTDGKMTQAQADAILGGEKARIELMLDQTMPKNGPMGGRMGPGGRGGLGGPETMTAVATVLGIDEVALRTELQGGKSIADVAKARNVDVAKVIAAIVDERTADIAQHVKDGDLTQAQADAQLKDLEARVTAMVDNAMPMRGKGGHMGQGGRGSHMGKGGRGGHMGQGGRGWFGFGPGDAAPTATPSGQGG
jgi:hypothetical protein